MTSISINVSDNLLAQIASEISKIDCDLTEEETDLNESAKKRWENGGKEIHTKYNEVGEEFENSDEYKDYMTWVRTAPNKL